MGKESTKEKETGKIQLLAICSSPKAGGHTDKLLERFIKAAGRYGASVTKIQLYKEKIPPFDGKLHHRRASLVAQNIRGLSRFQKALKGCDGFVIATPTYWFNVPGVLKNLIDHLTVLEEYGYWLEGKVAGFIVYSPHGGGTDVLENLALVFSNMGVVLPPYSMIHYGQSDDQWSPEDIGLLAKNIILQIRAQKTLGMSWDFDKHDGSHRRRSA